jgi:proteasome lid subunit RPN8/RPN11
MTLRLPDDLRNEIIDHCLAEAPNEGCGLIAVSGGAVVKVYKTANEEASPSGFTVPPEEHYEALSDAESHGWEIGGVFHSHPNGLARPSRVDVMGALDPEWFYLVVGLTGEPRLRAWRILDEQISEVPVE